jgi:hypothetical protein
MKERKEGEWGLKIVEENGGGRERKGNEEE